MFIAFLLQFVHLLFYPFLDNLKSPKTVKETTTDQIPTTDVISNSYTSTYSPNRLGSLPSFILGLLLGSFIYRTLLLYHPIDLDY